MPTPHVPSKVLRNNVLRRKEALPRIKSLHGSSTTESIIRLVLFFLKRWKLSMLLFLRLENMSSVFTGHHYVAFLMDSSERIHFLVPDLDSSQHCISSKSNLSTVKIRTYTSSAGSRISLNYQLESGTPQRPTLFDTSAAPLSLYQQLASQLASQLVSTLLTKIFT